MYHVSLHILLCICHFSKVVFLRYLSCHEWVRLRATVTSVIPPEVRLQWTFIVIRTGLTISRCEQECFFKWLVFSDRIYLGDRCCCHGCLHMLAPGTESKRYTLGNDSAEGQDTPCRSPDDSRLSLAQWCSLRPAGGTPGMLLVLYHLLLLLLSSDPGTAAVETVSLLFDCSHHSRPQVLQAVAF